MGGIAAASFIHYQCPRCQVGGRVRREHVDRLRSCPCCQLPFQRYGTTPPRPTPRPQLARPTPPLAVAAPPTTIKFHCPGCRHKLHVPAAAAGRKGRCPHCQTTTRVPDPQATPATPTPTSPPVDYDLWLSQESASLARDLEAIEAEARAGDGLAHDLAQAEAKQELALLPACTRPESTQPSSKPTTPSGRRDSRSRQRKRGGYREALAERTHLTTAERHLRAIGVVDMVAGALPLALGGLTLGVLALQGGPAMIAAVAMFGVLLVLGFGSLISIVVGFGLWHYQSWARWVATALLALQLLSGLTTSLDLLSDSAPAGLAALLLTCLWPGAQLWTLHNTAAQEVFTPDYRARVRASQRLTVNWTSSPFFLVPAVLFALGFLAGGLALLRVLG